MARANSWNVEVEIDGQTIHPLELGELGEGEEGRIKVADGSRAYQVRDQIFDIGEIMMKILVTSDRYEYDICQAWCTSGQSKNVYVIFRDSAKAARLTYLLTNTQLAMGKKNAFNRNSKEVDTKTYTMLPEYVEEVI
jgi:hypothetical protein